MEKRNCVGIITSIGYSLTGRLLQLSIEGCSCLRFVKPEDVHYGGKNCEISQMVVGSKIMFECQAKNHITNVVVMSDGVREVDEDGNLVKW